MKGDISPEATPMTKGGSLAANSLETPRAKSRCIAIKSRPNRKDAPRCSEGAQMTARYQI